MVDRIQYCTIMMMIVQLTDLIFKTIQDLYKNDKNYEFDLYNDREKTTISCHVMVISRGCNQQKHGLIMV